MCSGERHFVKAQNRAQPLAMYEQLPGFQGQDAATGKAQPSMWPGNLCNSPDILCMLPPPAPDGQPQVVQHANSGSEPLGRKHTSSFSIFKVDKRDCSCWHLCTSSLWTGCWAQSWEACQKKQHRSERRRRFLRNPEFSPLLMKRFILFCIPTTRKLAVSTCKQNPKTMCVNF